MRKLFKKGVSDSISVGGSKLVVLQKDEKLIAQIFTGKERYKPGNPAEQPVTQERQSWLQISYMKEAIYFPPCG